MDIPTLNWLRSPPGQALLAELAARPLEERDVLRELTRLRAHYPPELARAALEQSLLRRRARAKFPQADQLFFTREALEQASGHQIARHRCARYARYAHIADLCCGIGGDALAFAGAGHMVTAVDQDGERLALAAANAEALRLDGRIRLVQADLLAEEPPVADAIFCDPGRRSGSRRRFHVEDYAPPLSRVLAWRSSTPALAVKLAPGVDKAELAPVGPHELEFVSLDGELKEATLWCGPLAQTSTRATLLTTQADGSTHHVEMLPDAQLANRQSPISTPLAFFYEPDPAIIRAGLVAELAAHLDAAQLDPQIAYLTAGELRATPFARAWAVLEWMPFNLKRLRARLRELEAGPVTVKKRGSPLETDAMARQLSGAGPRPLVVVLTVVEARPAALICLTTARP